nr:MBG domain-containing protein [uncultured Prevotella sp.]
MKRKLFSLLVLLMAAVTGAWADATIAKLWVGNSEEVTSEGTITGTGATEGTASVAIENGSMVLTLNNFKFNGCGHNDSGIYYQSNANGNTPLIIKIEGDNEITLPGDAVKSLYGLFLYGGNGDHVFTITGSGSLTVTVGDGNLSNGIYVQQADLVLAGGTVTANVGNAGAEFKSLGVSVPQGTLTIDGGTLKASGSTTSASRGINVNNNVTIKSGELEAYGYSKGIKNSGSGDALVFAEGVTPTLFKAGDNKASATDVSKYEGQKYLHVVCTGGDEPAAPTGDGVNYALSVGTSEHGTVKFFVNETEVNTAAEGQTVTVEITPATGWSTGSIKGLWYAANGAAKAPKRTQSNIDMLKDFELNPVEGNPNAFTFEMKRANAEISVSYKKLLTNTDITIEDITALTYTGVAQEPVVTVKDGSVVLTKDVDYTVTYSNNTNAALSTATENAPTVTITAVATSDKYAGETTKTFTINKKALEDGFIANIDALVYTGVAQTPEPTVTYNNMTLVKGTDFTYSYTNNVNVAAATAENAPTVTVTGKGNYTGTAQKKFDITTAALTVTADNKQVTYGDAAPQYTVSYTGFVNNETAAVLGGTLAFACDYVKDQSGVGNYTITPSGLTSSNYAITFANGTLTVGAKALENGFIATISSLVYNGQAQEPAPVVTFNGMTLVKGTDYSVSYENNVNVGTATATVTALANSTKYSGSASKTFSITKKALTVKADNKSVTFGDDAPTYTESYDGFVNNETKAVLSGTLALTCSYVKNQTGAGNYDITPSGLTSSNYDITFTKGTLTVGKKALEDGFIADIQALIYNGLAQEPAPVVTFNGMTLVKGTDYSVSYENNVNVGTATATVTALANSTKYSGSASKTFSITKKALTVKADNKSVTYGDEAPAYTVSYDGFAAQENKDVLGGTLAFACDYVKDQSGVGTYTITPSGYTSDNYAITFTKGTLTVGKKALEDGFIANIASLVYNGVAQEPAPVVTFNGMTLVKGTDYTVAYSNNTNAGTATVTCTGQGNYSGQAQKTFTINPAVLTEATLKKTEFIYNAFDPQPQTAEVDVVKAGELIVPTTDYTVSDNTQTNLGDYKLTVTGKNNFQGSVKADFSIIKDDLPVTAEDTESGEEVDNVTIQVSVETDTETGEKTVIVDQLDVTPATSSQQVTVEIPSQINGVPVASIGAGALSAATNVSDIYMPETGETPIEVTDASLQAGDGKAIIHAPLQLLDNYAKMLPSHVGEKKVVSEVTQTAKRFWSFSCGVDVELPNGVTANIVKANTESQVTSEPIKGNVVKANNGVLLEGQQGVEYTLTAKAATGIGNDYEGNLLEPVIEKKHYGYGQGYYILKDGKFYAIANDAAAIPSCKAVLHIAGANARVINLVFSDETTGLSEKGIVNSEKFATATWYDLNGRKVAAPTKKGLYIMNGKKVVVK